MGEREGVVWMPKTFYIWYVNLTHVFYFYWEVTTNKFVNYCHSDVRLAFAMWHSYSDTSLYSWLMSHIGSMCMQHWALLKYARASRCSLSRLKYQHLHRGQQEANIFRELILPGPKMLTQGRRHDIRISHHLRSPPIKNYPKLRFICVLFPFVSSQ